MLQQLKGRVTPGAQHMLAGHGPLSPEWNRLLGDIHGSGFPFDIALSDVEPAMMDWLSRFVTFAIADGVITAEERAAYRRAVQGLYLSRESGRQC